MGSFSSVLLRSWVLGVGGVSSPWVSLASCPTWCLGPILKECQYFVNYLPLPVEEAPLPSEGSWSGALAAENQDSPS